MTRQKTQEIFFLMWTSILWCGSTHWALSISLPSLLASRVMKSQGKSGKSFWVWTEKSTSAPPLALEHSELPWVFSAGRTANNGELIWEFQCREAEVSPHCMNTVCFWLLLDHPVCPGIAHSLGGRGSQWASGEQRHKGYPPKCKHMEKASLWVRFRAQWNPVHLAADGCSSLDLVISLEKTSSVMVFSGSFSICTSCSDVTRTCN